MQNLNIRIKCCIWLMQTFRNSSYS